MDSDDESSDDEEGDDQRNAAGDEDEDDNEDDCHNSILKDYVVDPNICSECMLGETGEGMDEWFGCDTCPRWFHGTCLDE